MRYVSHRIFAVHLALLPPSPTMERVIISSSVAHQFPSDAPVVGRYAPSPSGDLHLGNLRTALWAWLEARSSEGKFVMRVEDLDRVKKGAAERQLADLQALGIDWDGEVLYQSTRIAAYQQVVEELTAQGLTYECFCTRKEIQSATSAPHAAPGAYPGTCRNLSEDERSRRRQDRPGAIRLRAQMREFTVVDDIAGEFTSDVDDFVLLRNDGTAAYNLASVLDDRYQGVTQIVRGDDLLPSAPRQAYLANLLGFPAPRYRHVPLALNGKGDRLAKRDGAVTLAEIRDRGVKDAEVLALIAASFPLKTIESDGTARFPSSAAEMLDVYQDSQPSNTPWTVQDEILKGVTIGG